MGMDKYAYFQSYFQGPDGMPNNFHDADESQAQNTGQFYMAEIYNDPSLMLYRIRQMRQYNIAPCIFDIIWCKSGLDTNNSSIALDKEKYFRETEFVSMREDWNRNDSAWLSFHGGYSNTAHDHVDVGTFVYNIGGVRWAIDPGREMLSYVSDNINPSIAAGYDSKYFYRRKGEGHNIVVINPDKNLEMDINEFAQVYKPVGGKSGSYSKIDLSAVYKSNVTSYTRGYLLTDNRRTLTVRDEMNLKKDSQMHWFMHTKGEIRIVDNNTAIIYQDGKQLKMQFITNAADAKLTAMNAESLETSPQFQNTENKGISKIDYQLKSSGETTITVKLSMIGEKGSETGVSDVNIAEWDSLINTDEETGVYEYGNKKLTGIYVDGEMISGFSPDKYKYNVSRDINGKAPEISVNDSDNAKIETYTKFNGSEVAVITITDEKGKETAYVVEIKEFDSTDITAAYNRHKLTAIAVSSEQIEEGINNVMSNSCDNDYETRWSANGTDEWCIYDLGESKPIDAVAVALWMGNQRQFSFDIEVSDDGENFTKVTSVTTDGKTEDAVAYKLEKSVKARYVKYVGHGSNVNAWNNVIEFMALQNKQS